MVPYPDRGAGNDPKPFFFFEGSGGWGGGGGEYFTTEAQHFYSGQYGSNDLLRPRRSALLVFPDISGLLDWAVGHWLVSFVTVFAVSGTVKSVHVIALLVTLHETAKFLEHIAM